ncbi:MAG TPA: alpha/beta fold hydrolase [Verrucomicrobiae bacterium]|nr:alpha/beta fold hydrolase [Verrucomicrobiae bacterium]
MTLFRAFADEEREPAVRGFLHEPEHGNGDGVVLTHGAGSNCQTRLLVELSNRLVASGWTVLRIDLPFRMARKFGPPSPGGAGQDREGLKKAASLMRKRVAGRIFVGGHSYGGRQATMLLAKDPDVAEGLLLLSYPLHPPRKPQELRTKHFPELRSAALFVHGTRDPFATSEEMREALELIPGKHELIEIEGAGHELLPKTGGEEVLEEMVRELGRFAGKIA